MCTVLLRFAPGDAWPLLLAAVRDEFVDRAWDPPGRHWADRLVGGRDRTAGGPPAPGPDAGPRLSTVDFWGDWVRLLGGDGLDPTDPRALLVRRTLPGRTYGSTSASLVAVRPGAVRYDFSAAPADPGQWGCILPAS